MPTDEELLADGNSNALETLMKRHASLYGYLVRELRDAHEAEDLLQEVFLRAWRSRKKFLGGSSVRVWIYAIARNLVIDHVRRRVPVPAPELTLIKTGSEESSSTADEPERSMMRKELASAIEEAILRLPEELRETFCLVRFDGMRYRDAAEVLGVTEAAVKMRMLRAMRQLRESLSPDWAMPGRVSSKREVAGDEA